MRLILMDRATKKRTNFYPLALSRPIWELRCGMTTLAEKLVAKVGANAVACFVPPYMAEVYRAQTTWPVNDLGSLAGDDLLLVDGRVKPSALDLPRSDHSSVGVEADGDVILAQITRADLEKLNTDSLGALLDSAKETLPEAAQEVPAWNYIWDLILANPQQIAEDFASLGRSGVEGTIEEPRAIRGAEADVYVAPGAVVHPMVVLDAMHGPIYIDQQAEIQPFARIEGPCYVGKGTILLGTNCREGTSIGPMCRIGGEVEESIIHGHSNKYHDGFLGHAYVGQWVNLGALTTNSDLKNDYSSVSVILDGRRPIDTGLTKVGALIGDHAKTSIGTLLNTGTYVGAMSLIMATGKPLAKYIPDFSWLIDGIVTKGFGKRKLYETADVTMGRRNCKWTDAQQAMWDHVFELTAPQRNPFIRRGRRQILQGK